MEMNEKGRGLKTIRNHQHESDKISNSEDAVGEGKGPWKYIVMDAKGQEYWSINLLTTQLQNVHDFDFFTKFQKHCRTHLVHNISYASQVAFLFSLQWLH